MLVSCILRSYTYDINMLNFNILYKYSHKIKFEKENQEVETIDSK